MFEGQKIQRKGGQRTGENKGKKKGGGEKKSKKDLLTEKFLMKWKVQEIENGQDNMTKVKLRLGKSQKEMQGLQRMWLEVCGSKISVGDQT